MTASPSYNGLYGYESWTRDGIALRADRPSPLPSPPSTSPSPTPLIPRSSPLSISLSTALCTITSGAHLLSFCQVCFSCGECYMVCSSASRVNHCNLCSLKGSLDQISFLPLFDLVFTLSHIRLDTQHWCRVPLLPSSLASFPGSLSCLYRFPVLCSFCMLCNFRPSFPSGTRGLMFSFFVV